jgi:hypothetical protein
MSEETKARVVAANAEHPDWTARQIAEHLGIETYHVYNHSRAAGLTLAPAPLPATVEAKPSRDVVDITVFATKPHEMVAAQSEMVLWAAGKVAEVKADLADAAAGFEIATANGWNTDAAGRLLNKATKMVTFYEKIEAALQSGYYIVPPFPIDVFTIRTNRKKPAKKDSTYRWDRHLQNAQLLPIGEGRYVSDAPTVFQRTYPAIEPGKQPVTNYFAEEFRDVAFPFGLAKPQVMEATAAAMALKVFDRLGVLPATRKPDPIICGQILKPDQYRTAVTFFVAWWLDTKTL